MKINITNLSAQSIGQAIAQLQQFAAKLNSDADTFANQLAGVGQLTASYWYSTDKDYEPRTDANVAVSVQKNQNAQNSYALTATGKAVAFLEFGAGITYSGNAHPWNGKVTPPMGPGTYPGAGHWKDPGGWYVPGTYDPSKKRSIKTLGNPPTKAMYNAFETMKQKNVYQPLAKQIFT